MPSPIRFSLHVAVLAFGAAFLLLAAPDARADTLDDAKAAGQVGEQRDGYLGLVVDDAPTEVKSTVADINARRREKYQAIAKKADSSLEAVAERAGVKLIARTESGHFVQDSGGSWVQK